MPPSPISAGAAPTSGCERRYTPPLAGGPAGEAAAMSRTSEVSRRSLLLSAAAAGGSLTLGFAIPVGPGPARASSDDREITAWIVIKPDETVIIRVAKSEMGQGSFTALPMLVAEEL